MKKRALRILILVFLLIAAAWIFVYQKIMTPDVALEDVKQAVQKHLSTKGYGNTDYQIDVSYHGDSKLFGYDPYVISVAFNDEASVVYYYKYDRREGRNEVTQRGIAPLDDRLDKNFKHAE